MKFTQTKIETILQRWMPLVVLFTLFSACFLRGSVVDKLSGVYSFERNNMKQMVRIKDGILINENDKNLWSIDSTKYSVRYWVKDTIKRKEVYIKDKRFDKDQELQVMFLLSPIDKNNGSYVIEFIQVEYGVKNRRYNKTWKEMRSFFKQELGR